MNLAKRKKLRKEVYYVLIGIIIITVGIIIAKNKYDEYKYKQSYEYKLLNHNYNKEEVNTILKTFNDDKELNFFLDNPANSKYVEVLKEKYFLKKNYNEYLEYMNTHRKQDMTSIVRNINIHLDKDFYSTDFKSDTSLDYKMLVNKYYLLDESYIPTDLVDVSQKYSWGDLGSQRVREIAYEAFQSMWEAANEDGYYLMINSSYRSYQDQDSIYENYRKTKGKKYADGIAARPGSSEHQTGLAIDIFSKRNTNRASFEDSEEATWLAQNSYKFGFILRYPKDKVNITGYNYESWHFRYVGIDIATYIYENNITLEEYYAYFLEK